MITLRLSAAVAPYLDAIQEAKAAGWRWGDIRKALDLACNDAAIAQAVRRCRWVAAQLPLPETVEAKKKATAAATASAQNAQTLEIPRNGKAEYRTGAEIISKASNFEMLS